MRKDKNRNRIAWLLCLTLCMSLALGARAGSLPAVYAAAGDPVLQFDLRTDSGVIGLKAGDQVTVEATVSRQDGLQTEYNLYSVMLDIDYDNDLFELSNLNNAGLRRPDGANWVGSWNCISIPASGSRERVRVVYTNIGGLMGPTRVLDRVSGTLTAGSFTLTVKPGVKLNGSGSQVGFYYSECAGSDLKRGDCIEGSELTLKLADSSGGTFGGSGSDAGNGSGSGSGTGSGGGSGVDSGSGLGTTSGSGSGTIAGSDSETTAGSGSGVSDGADGGTTTGKRIAFADLTDVPRNHWAAGSIEYLVNKGLAAGNESKQFQPEKPVTRAEFAQMIVSAFGYPAKAAAEHFGDITAADWYYQPIMALYEAGVVSGIGEGVFGPEQTLSRQDMAVILSRAMKDNNINLEVTRQYGEFADQGQVADYAQQALWNLYCTEIISGTSQKTLSPEAQSTRAQVAAVLANVLQKAEERR